MKIPFTDIEVSKAALVGTVATGLGWAGYSLGYGTAPVTVFTAIATPIATTLITGAAGLLGYGLDKELDKMGLDARDAQHNPENDLDKFYNYENHEPRSLLGKILDTTYVPSALNAFLGHDVEAEVEADEELTDVADESNPAGVLNSFFIKNATVTNRFGQLVNFNAKEINDMPERTTRSGVKF